MLGNRRDAQLAAEGKLVYLGHGAFRRTYLSPDSRLVYKVPILDNGRSLYIPDSDAQNTIEFMAAEFLRSTGFSKVVAPTGIWYVGSREYGRVVPIVAQAALLVSGRQGSSDQKKVIKKAVDTIHATFDGSRGGVIVHVSDMHDDNWRIDQRGRPMMTDLGLFELRRR